VTPRFAAVSAPEPSRDRKPPWLTVRAPGGAEYTRVKRTLRGLGLHTVCEHARCPNAGECWGRGTATVLLLGPTCTRACRFCSVAAGDPGGARDDLEPERTAAALETLGLQYAVITMVTRDDLADGGAAHVARTVREMRRLRPELLVETLVSDFGGMAANLDALLAARPDVFGHNVEVTRGMTPRIRDARCSFDRSLDVLRHARRDGRVKTVKSSLMVGVGETDGEVLDALGELREAGVDIVTIGQYLRPTPRHWPVARYVHPEQFAEYERAGHAMGFALIASGPLVRSSYRAAESFVRAQSAHGPEGGATSG
jgi:lipoyl synthase